MAPRGIHPPGTVVLFEDDDPDHAPSRPPSRQEGLVPLRRRLALGRADLDGRPTPPLPGPLGQAQAALAVDRRPAPTPLLPRRQYRWQVVEGGILSETSDDDEAGCLRRLEKLALGVAAIDGQPGRPAGGGEM